MTTRNLTRLQLPPTPTAMFRPDAASGHATSLGNRHSGKPESWELPILAELGAILVAARVATGLAIRDLAPIAGNPATIRAIERGAVRTRASRLRPWLEHLGIDPDPVLERFASVIAPERPDGRTGIRVAPIKPIRERLAYRSERSGTGAVLCRLRVTFGLSSRQLARLIGCTWIAVLLVERGLRRPSAVLVARWLDAVAADHLERAGVLEQFPDLISSRPPGATGLGWHRQARVNPTESGVTRAESPNRTPVGAPQVLSKGASDTVHPSQSPER